jgi:hypothetical protein
MPELVCHHCGAPVRFEEPLGRERTCDACGGDLRCCVNCRHHDPRYHNECTEPLADPVEDRRRRNFCEYFYYSRAAFSGARAGGNREAEARARLASLFGGTSAAGGQPGPGAKPAPNADAARRKLEDLFRKPSPPGE